MATMHQRGYVTTRGKQWYGYYRKVVNDPATNEQKTVRVLVNLGLKSKMNKTEARQTLEREITKQLGQTGSPTRILNDGSVTFAWFVTNRFIPLKEAVWKDETAKTKKFLIQSDLVEPLGEIPLANFDKFSLQLHLNKLATNGSKDRVLQMRAYLRRGSRSGLPRERSCSQDQGTRSIATHGYDDAYLGSTTNGALETQTSRSHFA